MTPTPSPTRPGALAGQVYDDANAVPLSGVTARGPLFPTGEAQGDPQTTTTDANGRYVLSLPPGEQFVELTKDGYTRALRAVSVVEDAGAAIDSARLTRLADPVTIGSDGGTAYAGLSDCAAPCAADTPTPAAQIELAVPAATATAAPLSVRLTALGPQGLILPPPLGWSVLLGADVRVEGAAGASAAGWASLPIPQSVLTDAGVAPASVTVALWDDATLSWLAGPTPQVSGDRPEPLPCTKGAETGRRSVKSDSGK